MPCNLYLIFQIVERAAPSVRCLPSAWKTIGHALGKKNRASFVRHALKDTGVKKNILLCLGKDSHSKGTWCVVQQQASFCFQGMYSR